MNYINIDPNTLEVEKKFEFFIFLFEEYSHKRTVLLDYLTELTEEKKNEMLALYDKNAKIQILEEDIEVFLEVCSCDLDFLKSLNEIFFKCREVRVKREKTVFLEEEFSFKDTLQDCIQSDDFLPLIVRARNEILSLDLCHTQDVSNTSAIVEKIFQKDLNFVREASFVYFFAQTFQLKDPQLLCDIVMASMVKDFGEFLLSRSDIFSDDMKSDNYEKHPMLTIYYLSKSLLKLNKNTMRFILEHHESADGEGFPRQKKQEQIETASFIISLAHEIFNYNDIYKEKKSLMDIFRIFASQNLAAQGRIRFPEAITDPLKITLIRN